MIEGRDSSVRHRGDSLEYIQAMLGQLRGMAEGERYDMLAYLIEMAYVEASDIMRGERPAGSKQRGRPRLDKRNSAA